MELKKDVKIDLEVDVKKEAKVNKVLEPKVKLKVNKDALNIIRTTMRNNIDLTQIADNKANVLLSLNALMITFLVPFAIPNIQFIRDFNLAIPLILLVITAFITIYLSVLVLIPRGFSEKEQVIEKGKSFSPFFFGNFYKMNMIEYKKYIMDAISKPNSLIDHITDDLYYTGAVLGQKMTIIRRAFRIFLIGFFSSISMAIVFLLIFG